MKSVCFKFCWVFAMFFSLNACMDRQSPVSERFSTPEKTYRFWMEASEKEDIPKSMQCLTESSKRIMEAQLRQMDIFMARMRANVAIFGTYTLVDQKIKDDKAVVLLKGKNGDVIPVPMKKESDGWKIDMVALFSGSS